MSVSCETICQLSIPFTGSQRVVNLWCAKKTLECFLLAQSHEYLIGMKNENEKDGWHKWAMSFLFGYIRKAIPVLMSQNIFHPSCLCFRHSLLRIWDAQIHAEGSIFHEAMSLFGEKRLRSYVGFIYMVICLEFSSFCILGSWLWWKISRDYLLESFLAHVCCFSCFPGWLDGSHLAGWHGNVWASRPEVSSSLRVFEPDWCGTRTQPPDAGSVPEHPPAVSEVRRWVQVCTQEAWEGARQEASRPPPAPILTKSWKCALSQVRTQRWEAWIQNRFLCPLLAASTQFEKYIYGLVAWVRKDPCWNFVQILTGMHVHNRVWKSVAMRQSRVARTVQWGDLSLHSPGHGCFYHWLTFIFHLCSGHLAFEDIFTLQISGKFSLYSKFLFLKKQCLHPYGPFQCPRPGESLRQYITVSGGGISIDELCLFQCGGPALGTST